MKYSICFFHHIPRRNLFNTHFLNKYTKYHNNYGYLDKMPHVWTNIGQKLSSLVIRLYIRQRLMLYSFIIDVFVSAPIFSDKINKVTLKIIRKNDTNKTIFICFPSILCWINGTKCTFLLRLLWNGTKKRIFKISYILYLVSKIYFYLYIILYIYFLQQFTTIRSQFHNEFICAYMKLL